MDEIYLSVKDVAVLKGCSARYIQQLIAVNKLRSEIVEVQTLGPGRGGIQYRIPLSALDKKLQLKYKRQQRESTRPDSCPSLAPTPEVLNFEGITAAEREQITFWKSIIREWDLFRSDAASKAKGDEMFAHHIQAKWQKKPPPCSLSNNTQALIRVLYRKRKALYTVGERGLIDKRGKHGNHTRKLTEEMFDIFEFYYLHPTKKSVNLCMFLTGEELKRLYKQEPSLPSSDTFERAAKSISIPIIKYYREGREEFIGDCEPYIKRTYEGLMPNDIWVADGHTWDIMVLGKDGKPFRPCLSAFMDVRTRKLMGWLVTDKTCGDTTVYALKKGVEKYGAPKMIYTDNGREYLFHDFSGDAGFRKKAKPKDGEFKPPTILEHLGVEIRTAIPKNARAKGIERAFETFKETFSKLFDSYTGGNVLEKPDSLGQALKHPDKLITIDEFVQKVDAFITGFYNKQPHRGEGMYGKSPDEVYATLYHEKRVVPADKLNLMFMRYSKGTVKVGKNGVTLKVYGAELQYFTAELWQEYYGKEVYVRYSPDNLSNVRVYNTENQFICEAPLKTKLGYNATKEDIQEAQRENKVAVKAVKNYKRLKGVAAQDALDAVINKSMENLENPETLSPNVLRMIQTDAALPMAVGAENAEPIDWTDALKKLKERKSMQA